VIDRTATPADHDAVRLTPAEEEAVRSAILAQLHRFAHATGAEPGDDVVRWFDGRLRGAVERREHLARVG
jgi:hypothetical protein